ncbi:MAG: N-acetyl-gamma-glutamyl-phosphate reductase [Chloroflexota bacterium]|nr:N-acetyl-gamma-glutamyl-phosphate reductase [Chloroflexota bacterium]
MNAGIINVTGYAGCELARILYQHPEINLTTVTGRSSAGENLSEVFPHLANLNLTITPELDGSVDVVFSALPHKASAEAVIPLVEQGIKTIDISADFRLKSTEEYSQWYGVDHPDPSYLSKSVYGLTEIHRQAISQSRLIANPGCYPTSAILGLAPAVSLGIISEDIIIDSKSGVSGAGRSLALTTHYSEVNENVMAYSLGGHRHLPEIVQELGDLTDTNLNITFLTHLIPMTRGILSSCYAPLKAPYDKTDTEVRELYQEFYKGSPFVQITEHPPQTKQTLGNNNCLVFPTIDKRTNRLIVISCIDNLVKGAAGMAVQNMNVMFGWPEDLALKTLAVYP